MARATVNQRRRSSGQDGAARHRSSAPAMGGEDDGPTGGRHRGDVALYRRRLRRKM
jgi:hypothetical protein